MRKLLTVTFALFYFWVFTFNAAAAVKVPNVCETQSVDCFVLNLGKNAYAFHWKGNKIYYKKKNVKSLKINGRVVSSSDSPIESVPLKWSYNNRVINLSSDIINLSIDYKKDRLLTVNGKALGNLDYAFQKMEDAFKSEKSKIMKRQAQKTQDNFLKVGFSKLSAEQRKQVQSLLSNLGLYNSSVDGLWGNGTLRAVREFARNYNLGKKLAPANDVSAAAEIYSKIFSYKTDEAVYLDAVKKKEEENRLKEELAAAKERERKKREVEEQKLFCENAQASDFWKRFSFLRDKPINILGIDMSLTANEAKKVLECKSYYCQNKTSIWGVQQLVCSKGNAEVTISGASFSFNCASLNVCGLSGDEVAMELIKAGKAFSMEPSVQYLEDIQVLKYCDRGRAGDILCVVENELAKAFGAGTSVTIEKGNLGKAKPAFD